MEHSVSDYLSVAELGTCLGSW